MNLVAATVYVTDGLVIKIFGVPININDLWSTVIAGLIVCFFGLMIARKASPGVPSKGQVFWELVVNTTSDQVERMVGPEGRPIVPLAITLFVFILVCNWLEIFFWMGDNPSYLPTPTSNVNIDYMMALVVFVVTNAAAIKHAGFLKYIAHFFRKPVWMFPIHIIEELTKPLSLSLRLFGNVFTGALIFALLAGLFASFPPPIFFFAILWLPFDLFIFVIQAFIFALLAVIYYQQALSVGKGAH